jgi:radical SAM superfamily enzyme YgiQ (UPF0313 family)
MRAPGDILLISCYELGHQPFHLALLLRMLRQAGYTPVAIDTAVESLTDESIQQAQLVAISVPMHTALRLGQQIALRIRSLNPPAHICFYGHYALLNADYLLQECADSVIGGEYEATIIRLIKAIEHGDTVARDGRGEDFKRAAQDIADHPPDGPRHRFAWQSPGLPTWTLRALHHARTAKSGPNLQRTEFLVPERSALPGLERYARLEFGGQIRLSGYTETTRGCKHTCLHCPITPIYDGHFFAIPAEIVLEDIRAQVANGASHITFGDPDFFNGPTHAMRISRALHKEFPDVTFDATIKIEHLLKQRHLLPELHELGCLFIVSAVESINDTVLERLDKGHTSADVSEAFDVLEQAGIVLRPSLLPFSPWETLESYIALLNFFEERHLIEHIDPVHFSIRLLIPPGSAILEAPDSQDWLGELDAPAYTYLWRHPDPRMDALQRDVAALVEKAEEVHADPIETFFAIKALALSSIGQSLYLSCAVQNYGVGKVLPHLTETWFC